MKAKFTSLIICIVFLVVMTPTVQASPVKVLHVSEWMHDEVQRIVSSVGANGLFEVAQTSYWDYPGDAPDSLDEYDVIVFGLSDCYDFHWPLDELLDFLDRGGGVVFTHDTMSRVMPQDLRDLAGIGPWTEDWVWGEAAEIIEEHAVLHFPFEIGDVGNFLDVQSTHNVVELLPTAQKIMKFLGEDGPNNFYLTASEYGAGRIILNQIGHGLGFPCHDPEPGEIALVEIPTIAESAIFVNCLYWAGIDTPIELCADLIAQVEGLGLPKGIENSLVTKLENAIGSTKKGQAKAAVNKLEAFINAVEAQQGKKIPKDDADALMDAGLAIVAVLESM